MKEVAPDSWIIYVLLSNLVDKKINVHIVSLRQGSEIYRNTDVI